jgi:hypothetical protein
MTIVEMHDFVDLLVDKANAPWFNPSEKDRFLNLAINEFAKTRYRAFELNEKRRSDLLPLVRTAVVNNSSVINLDAIVPKFMFSLSLSADFDNAKCGALKGRSVKPIQIDDYISIQSDPFNKPSDAGPIYIQRNTGTANEIQVFSDTTPTRLELVYFKYPTTVLRDVTTPANNVDCDLPDYTHEEIVNLCVRKMFATIESQSYQVQMNEINNQE